MFSRHQPDGVLHHADELLVVNLAIAIHVDAGEQLPDMLLAEGEVVAGEARAQLSLTDLSTAVLVEVCKRRA